MSAGSEPVGQDPARQPGLRASQRPPHPGLPGDQVSHLVPRQQAQPLKRPGRPLRMPGRLRLLSLP